MRRGILNMSSSHEGIGVFAGSGRSGALTNIVDEGICPSD